MPVRRTQVSIVTLRPGDVIEVTPGQPIAPATGGELLVPYSSFDESTLIGGIPFW
ncbi:MAG: hypothetical protein ACR5K7_01670 [Symbiopectobacterium sp.]